MHDDFYKKHKVLVTLIVATFIALAAGEYYLYRNQFQIKSMISEGLMQVKEELKKDIQPTGMMPKAK